MSWDSDQPKLVRVEAGEPPSQDADTAELHVPSGGYASPRQPGALTGWIWMAEDFNDLPPDILEAMGL